MMYYFIDKTDAITGELQRHIVIPQPSGGVTVFPLTNDNPNKPAYDAWLAEGNTPEEWNPDGSV